MQSSWSNIIKVEENYKKTSLCDYRLYKNEKNIQIESLIESHTLEATLNSSDEAFNWRQLNITKFSFFMLINNKQPIYKKGCLYLHSQENWKFKKNDAIQTVLQSIISNLWQYQFFWKT